MPCKFLAEKTDIYSASFSNAHFPTQKKFKGHCRSKLKTGKQSRIKLIKLEETQSCKSLAEKTDIYSVSFSNTHFPIQKNSKVTVTQN
jgi:hypothetical protein